MCSCNARPQMGNVEAEVELQFNSTTSPDEIPQAEEVVEALIMAVNNPNSTFNLTLDSDSITVIRSTSNGATTTTGSTTSVVITTAGGSITSPGLMTTISSGVSTTTSGSSSNGSNTPHGSTTTVNPPATAESTTASPFITTDGSATSQFPTIPGGSGGAVTTAPVFVLAATLEEPFVEELNDRNSVQYRTLEIQVVTLCDIIYRARFGILFVRTVVIRFRRVAVRTRMENTEAEVRLEFNNTATPNQIPQADVVVQTLGDALTNPNNTFNLTVDINSIEIRQTPNITSSTPTAAPNSNTTATITTTATTARPVTTATTIAVTQVAATTVQVIRRRLTFTSVGETFTNDLLNPSSSAFISRARMIKLMLEPFFRSAFSAFRSLTVISFSNGSIINTSDLEFTNTSIPNGTQIASVLVNAASNITAFNIDTTSIIVDGIQVSSGVSHKISLITAFFLVLLSWLLSSCQ